MTTASITLPPHVVPSTASPLYPDLEEREQCEPDFTFEVEYEHADPNYGADADGRRGVSIPGYYWPAVNAPTICSTCAHVFTREEHIAIDKLMTDAASAVEYEEEYTGPDGPDDYDE